MKYYVFPKCVYNDPAKAIDQFNDDFYWLAADGYFELNGIDRCNIPPHEHPFSYGYDPDIKKLNDGILKLYSQIYDEKPVILMVFRHDDPDIYKRVLHITQNSSRREILVDNDPMYRAYHAAVKARNV